MKTAVRHILIVCVVWGSYFANADPITVSITPPDPFWGSGGMFGMTWEPNTTGLITLPLGVPITIDLGTINYVPDTTEFGHLGLLHLDTQMGTPYGSTFANVGWSEFGAWVDNMSIPSCDNTDPCEAFSFIYIYNIPIPPFLFGPNGSGIIANGGVYAYDQFFARDGPASSVPLELTLTYMQAPQLPEPSSMLLLGIGVMAMAAVTRRVTRRHAQSSDDASCCWR